MANKFYATADADSNGWIGVDAKIHVFNSMREVTDFLLRGHLEYEPGVEYKIVEGRYSDCWTKSHNMPNKYDNWFQPFSLHQLNICSPGSHPGGSGYWITPVPSVYVAVLA